VFVLVIVTALEISCQRLWFSASDVLPLAPAAMPSLFLQDCQLMPSLSGKLGDGVVDLKQSPAAPHLQLCNKAAAELLESETLTKRQERIKEYYGGELVDDDTVTRESILLLQYRHYRGVKS
jgi:hypothetical protein